MERNSKRAVPVRKGSGAGQEAPRNGHLSGLGPSHARLEKGRGPAWCPQEPEGKEEDRSHPAGHRSGLALRAFHRDVIDILKRARIPALVGGGYAMAKHTAIKRPVKDLDLFLRRRDCRRALQVLTDAGYRTGLAFKHWLAKVHCEDEYIDLIFSSGNGLCAVTDLWFDFAVPVRVLGRRVHVCAAEEMIWSKAFIMERERYDGADVAHLLRATGRSLDWGRLLRHFGPHWPVLLSHLILFDFIYPGEPSPIPQEVVRILLTRWSEQRGQALASADLCQGTLLSRAQYLVDVEKWGYRDARLSPGGTMTTEEIKEWTAPVIEKETQLTTEAETE